MEQQQFKYYAFISYSSRDIEWGKRVQRKLESYRLPATLCSEHGWERTPIKPIFFAPYDIQPGGLSEELQQRLRLSRNLIVIGSPNSAQSEWVGKEIEFFHRLGRTSEIHYFIVGGEPNSGEPATECYNPILKHLGIPEILGANIHERVYRWPWLNRERAYVQLVSKLLGVEFNDIWQRHKRLLIQKAIAWIIGIMAVLAALLSVWSTSQPVDIEVKLSEATVHNDALPEMKDAVVTMSLENEVKTCTIHSFTSIATFKNIPHQFLGSKTHITVICNDFLPIDTALTLSPLLSLAIGRDETAYGNVGFRLWKIETEDSFPGTMVTVGDIPAVSDSKGWVRIRIPLTEQREYYTVSCPALPLADSVIPAKTTESSVLRVK